MVRQIKYIGFYNKSQTIKRPSSLAAITKMDYISNALNELGHKVYIVSPSWVTFCKPLFKRFKTKFVCNKINIIYCPSIIPKSKFDIIINIIFSQLWLFYWLINNVKKKEKIIVYHSLWLILPIYLAKKIKKFQLILEVEEIYSDVISVNKIVAFLENKIIKEAESCLFSNDQLSKLYPKENSIVIYGTYKCTQIFNSKFYDNDVHIVYSGTLDPTKGSILAIKTANYLPNNYHIHILGFGSDLQINNVLELINENNKNDNIAKISFEGLLVDTDYYKFLQKCHIGLSTQYNDNKYNLTSFPSKILSYMSNGLDVVSINLPAIKESELSNNIYFYNNPDPLEIASIIKQIDLSKTNNNRDLIEKLNKNLLNKFELLF